MEGHCPPLGLSGVAAGPSYQQLSGQRGNRITWNPGGEVLGRLKCPGNQMKGRLDALGLHLWKEMGLEEYRKEGLFSHLSLAQVPHSGQTAPGSFGNFLIENASPLS